MIENTYRCDLCRDIRPPNEILGIYWTHNVAIKREVIEAKDPRHTEHHLCPRCIRDLTAVFEDIHHHIPGPIGDALHRGEYPP